MKVVMALSGGMDSATVLAKLLHEGNEVECLFFHYGSKHNAHEVNGAIALARHYGVQLHAINISPLMATFKSDLLKSGGGIPEGHYNDESMARTVVPARNIIFLSILAGHAWSVDAGQIAIGIHQGDHAIYADCRSEFYKAMDTAIFLGTDRRVEIVAPFVHTDKTGILAWGLAHRVPYHLTRTCYQDRDESCGVCGSCQERLEAFRNHLVIDPVKYEGDINKQNLHPATTQLTLEEVLPYDALLENWTVLQSCFIGDIYGDKKGHFPDGTCVTTSPIAFAEPGVRLGEGVIVRTRNTRYLLGKPARI